MINLKSDKNQKTNETRLVQILFYTFPLWFIVGNLAVSLNTLLFIAASLFLIKKKQLTFRFNNLNWLLIIFFSYFFLSTTIHFLSPGVLNDRLETLLLENNPIFKSFLLIRFIILIFAAFFHACWSALIKSSSNPLSLMGITSMMELLIFLPLTL